MKKLIILFLLIPFIVLAGEKRSSEWERVRKTYLSEHKQCALCGSEKSVQIHHKIPFQFKPELELEPSNLIGLCTSKYWGVNCHLIVGHSTNWKWENPNVIEDIKVLKEIAERTKCYKDGCMENDEFAQYVKEMKIRTKEYMCEQYGKCGKGRKR